MRTKVTLVLVFLNVALFFFIFKFERPWRVQESLREARRRVLGPEAADIRSLEIATPTATVRLERRADTWFIVKPQEWPANPHAISTILNELQLLEDITHFGTKDLAANSQSLADYGLEKPKLTVTFASGTAASTTLRIGDSTKIGNRLYILSPEGDRIHVVARALADALSLSLDQLRADSLLTIPVFEARALSVQTASVRVRLRREGGSRWFFDTIINNARASKNALDLTIGALNSLHVKTFAPATQPTTLPSASPALRVTLEGNNRRETLLLGDPVPISPSPTPNSQLSTPSSQPSEYYAQLEGRAALFTVVVPAALMQDLRNAQVALRETHILDFDQRTVTAVTLTAPNQSPLTLQRLETAAGTTDPTWQIVRRGDTAQGPQTLPADRATVQRLLQQLTDLSAKNFQSDAPTNADLENWGFNRPEREITLTLAAPAAPPAVTATAPASPAPASTTIILHLGTATAGALYARLDPATNPKGTIYAVTLDLARELSVIPRDWRERALPALPATARLTAVKLTNLADNSVLLDTALDDSGHPKSEIKNPSSLAPVLAQLRAPRAKRFVQDAFSDQVTVAGESRPWKLKLEATVSLPGGAGGEQSSVRTLLFTDRVGGAQQLAGSKEFDAVFEIEQPLLDALWTLAYGPRDPGAK